MAAIIDSMIIDIDVNCCLGEVSVKAENCYYETKLLVKCCTELVPHILYEALTLSEFGSLATHIFQWS